MFEKYKVPDELYLHIFSFLGRRHLSRLSKVNKQTKKFADSNQLWSRFLTKNVNIYSGSYKELSKQYYLKIINEFKFTPNELNSLHSHLYLDLYEHLRRLDEYMLRGDDDWLDNFYYHKDNRLLILKCCTDDVTYTNDLFEAKDPNLSYPFLHLSIISGSINLSKNLFNKLPIDEDIQASACACLETASEAGNFEMGRFLLEKFPALVVYQDHLDLTANSGCVELFTLLLKNSKLQPTQNTFDVAVRSGNKDLVILLRELNPSFTYSLVTLKCAVTGRSNAENMTSYVLSQNLQLIPIQETLHHAAKFGSVRLITILLERNPQLKLDDLTIYNAGKNGNQDLLTFFESESELENHLYRP